MKGNYLHLGQGKWQPGQESSKQSHKSRPECSKTPCSTLSFIFIILAKRLSITSIITFNYHLVIIDAVLFGWGGGGCTVPPVTLAFAFLSLEGLKSDKNLLLSSSLACRLFRTLCFFFLFFFSSRDRSWKRKNSNTIFFTVLLNHLHPRIRLGEVSDLCGFSPWPSHKVGHPDSMSGANLKSVCNRG